MSRGIRFKLYDHEERLALAFQHHCQRNLGVNDDLNTLAKKILLKFLNDAVDRKASDPVDLQKVGVTDASRADSETQNGEVIHESGEAVAAGDSGSDAVAPESVPVDTLADTQAVYGEAPAT